MNDDVMLRVLVILAVVALVGLAIWHPAPRPPLASADPVATPVPRRAARHAPAPRPPAALVYVVGAVNRPGLYRLADGARIDDAVRAAGGLRAQADAAAVNLAAHASDGDEIFVPAIGQATPATARATGARSRRSRVTKTHAIVSVNSASAQALASVPGIGATIAAHIVQVRDADGAFRALDELLDVAGMTQSRLDRARPYLRL